MAAVNSPRSGAGFRPPLLSAGGIVLHRSQRYSRLPSCGSAGANHLDEPQNHSSRRGRVFGFQFYFGQLQPRLRHRRVLAGERQHALLRPGDNCSGIYLGHISRLDCRAHQHAAGAADRPGHTRPDYYSRCDHHGLVDFDGEPEHRNFESPHRFADRCNADFSTSIHSGAWSGCSRWK